jgi:hypothetical protein
MYDNVNTMLKIFINIFIQFLLVLGLAQRQTNNFDKIVTLGTIQTVRDCSVNFSTQWLNDNCDSFCN